MDIFTLMNILYNKLFYFIYFSELNIFDYFNFNRNIENLFLVSSSIMLFDFGNLKNKESIV